MGARLASELALTAAGALLDRLAVDGSEPCVSTEGVEGTAHQISVVEDEGPASSGEDAKGGGGAWA